MRVVRTDFAGSVRGVTRTPQGGLRMGAVLTRVGVLRYRDAQGREWGELRHPDEVFATDSLATLRSAPVTNLHPDVPVTSENYAALNAGHVHDDVGVEDGRLVVATVSVQRAAEVKLVESGDRKEVSCGYECEVEPASGVWEGVPYEGIQRRIVYNHVAIGPEGWGRAGSEVSLRLDGAAVEVRGDNAPKGNTTVKTITIRGKVYRIDAPEDMAAAQADMAAMEKKADADAGELAAVKAALMDALQKVAALEAKQTAAAAAQPTVTEAMVPDEVADALVSKRLALRERAARVLGAEAKLDGKSAKELHREVIAKAMPSMKLDGMSEDFIAGMFLTLTEKSENASNSTRNDALAEAHRAAAGAREDGAPAQNHDDPADAARKATATRWQKPFTVSANALTGERN